MVKRILEMLCKILTCPLKILGSIDVLMWTLDLQQNDHLSNSFDNFISQGVSRETESKGDIYQIILKDWFTQVWRLRSPASYCLQAKGAGKLMM